ncbi:MAG: hypothetical protein LQ340_000498, partial [Diploschistes diacapsis]
APNGGAVAMINGVCCLGTQTTASDGSDACCKGGSFTLSQPSGFPFGTASDLVSIPLGSCATVVPLTQTDYSSVMGLSTNAASKAGAAPALVTKGPVLAGALAGLAGAAALL